MKQVTAEQAAAIAALIDRWAEDGIADIQFKLLDWRGLWFMVWINGECAQRYEILRDGAIDLYSANRYGIDHHQAIEAELADQGLRIAYFTESGWYTPTSFGTVWATDLPLEN